MTKTDLSFAERGIRSDLAALESRLEMAIECAQRNLVMWFAGIMVVNATAVVMLTVALLQLL